jgi:elongation factor P--beta-lysine ligase
LTIQKKCSNLFKVSQVQQNKTREYYKDKKIKKIETTYFQSFSCQTTTQQNIATKTIKPRSSRKLSLELQAQKQNKKI